MAGVAIDTAQVFDYLERKRSEHLEELCELLRIASVSTDSQHTKEIRSAARWVVRALKKTGLRDAALFETPGYPVVIGSSQQLKGQPTLLIYGHYDVQPPEPLDRWTTPPFEPVVRKNRLYARGAADDKGQFFIHLKVLEALNALYGRIPFNVIVLIEGEEEIGSPNLPAFLKRHAKRLACDAILISDTQMHGLRDPSITVGLRGIVALEVIVRSARQDLHSGVFGGAIVNPIQVLAEVLVAAKNPESGRIRIPGFYQNVGRITQAQRDALSDSAAREKAFLRTSGVKIPFGERGYTTAERTGLRPTFEINGISGGYSGKGIKTVLPAEARAKISMRLVGDQEPEAMIKCFRTFLKEITPPHVRITLKKLENSGRPARTDLRFPPLAMARRSIARVFGKEPVLSMEGGSVPIVADFKRVLGCDAVLLGFGLPDDRLHAPDESFDLRMLELGKKTMVHFFAEWTKGA